MSRKPVVEQHVEHDGRQFLIQVFSMEGRFVATTQFAVDDVIEIDGFSQEEAFQRCCQLLPLALLTRQVSRQNPMTR